jgi:hypothetical protein
VMCKCVFAFLFMLLNYKIQKKTKKNKWLIWIWLNISRTNKIILYFSWNVRTYVFIYYCYLFLGSH